MNWVETKENGAYTTKGVMLNKIKYDDKKSKSTELTNAIVAKFYSFKKIFPPALKKFSVPSFKKSN